MSPSLEVATMASEPLHSPVGSAMRAALNVALLNNAPLPSVVTKTQNHQYETFPPDEGVIKPIPHHTDLFRAVASKMPDSALERWNDKKGDDGKLVRGMQHQLHVDLDVVRTTITKKCKPKSGSEATVQMPELRMVGGKVGTGNLVKLETTIWISCTCKCSKNKVKEFLRRDLPWVQDNCQNLGWRLEVRVDPPAVFSAVEYPARLTNLTLERPIRLRDNTEMYLHVEDSDDNTSACGRYLCTTFVGEGNVTKQRFSRLGGLIDLNGKTLVVTTAHSILERFMSDLQPPSEELQSDSSQDDQSDEPASKSDDDTDDNGCASDQSGPSEPSIPHPNALGYKDPATISSWKPIQFGGPINFLGLGRHTLTSQAGGGKAPQHPPGTDFALFELGPEMVTAENTYSDPTAYKTLVGSYSEKQDMKYGPVEILVDDERPEHGFLLPQASGIYIRGIMLETRKVELHAPLGRKSITWVCVLVQVKLTTTITARGTSGAWVVQGDKLRGMIIAVYDDEPFAHMIAIEKLFPDILESYPPGAKINLPNG